MLSSMKQGSSRHASILVFLAAWRAERTKPKRTRRQSLRYFRTVLQEHLTRNPSQFFGYELWIWIVSVGSVDGINKELVDATSVSGTSSYYSPGSLTETHTGPTSSSLCYPPVDYHKTNGLFGTIIRWRNSFPFQEQKVAFFS